METSIGKKLFKEYSDYYGYYLTKMGFDISSFQEDSCKVFLSYLQWQKRMISTKPRKIFESNELKCPENLQESFNCIKKIFATGGDLTGYLSRRIEKINQYDKLLYDWGIHHLHFHDYKTTGLRSGELLYVYLTDESTYLIDIKNHNDFCNEDLINILDANWSYITEPLSIKGSDFEYAALFNPSDRKALRNANINVPIILKNGKALMSMMLGGGISSSGDSSEAVHKLLDVQRSFDDIGEYLDRVIKYKIDDVLLQLFNEKMDFSLTTAINPKGIYEWIVIDENTRSSVPLNFLLKRVEMMNSSPEVFSQYLEN